MALHQEILHADGFIESGLRDNAVDFREVAHGGTGLDVLEVDIGVLAMGKHVSEEDEHALPGAEALEHLDTLLLIDLGGVLDGDLGHDLLISRVRLEHVVHALEAVFLVELAEHIHDLIFGNHGHVEDHSLDVSGADVVLEGTSEQTGVLAHLSHGDTIVVSKGVQVEQTVGHGGVGLKVHHKQTGLEMAFILAVLTEHLDEELGALGDLAKLSENIGHSTSISLGGTVIAAADHLSKVGASLGVDGHDLAEDLDEIGEVTTLLAEGHNLVQLVSLNETLDNLLRVA
mmetsp:Transcript_41614/g.63517  ORF Transcript_41614/g.63517 Transcript_41614/m.63517 type:complete len:287 (-) Transcript_41614:1156-2016(-)